MLELKVTSIKTSVGTLIAVASTAISTLLGANAMAIKILIGCMVADYVTGLIVAGIFGKSPKTSKGCIESKESLKGLCRKCMMLVYVFVGASLDIVIGADYIATAIIFFFIANEVISLTENAGIMGLPVPPIISNAIEVLKKKSEGGN
ncbi:MAG: holin family protein [Aminipila sp.]